MTRVTPIVLLVFALLSTATAAAGETLQNGGFEAQTMSPWEASRWNGDANVELDRKQVHSGVCSIRLQAREDGATAVVTQTVKRLPKNGGHVAFLAGQWRGEELSGTGGQIVVRMLGPDGQQLCEEQRAGQRR